MQLRAKILISRLFARGLPFRAKLCLLPLELLRLPPRMLIWI
jgi:hypothetical protein